MCACELYFLGKTWVPHVELMGGKQTLGFWSRDLVKKSSLHLGSFLILSWNLANDPRADLMPLFFLTQSVCVWSAELDFQYGDCVFMMSSWGISQRKRKYCFYTLQITKLLGGRRGCILVSLRPGGVGGGGGGDGGWGWGSGGSERRRYCCSS